MGQLCWQCDELLGAGADAGEAVVDVPADAVHIFAESGRQTETTGWFGAFDDWGHDLGDAIGGTSDPESGGLFADLDRVWDYRSLTGDLNPETADWADPDNEAAQGLSGFFGAVTQQSGAAAEDALELGADAAGFGLREVLQQLLEDPLLLAVAVLVGIYVVGQLFDVDLGGIGT